MFKRVTNVPLAVNLRPLLDRFGEENCVDSGEVNLVKSSGSSEVSH